MKNPIFWDMTPRRPVKVNRRFGGTYLHSGRVGTPRRQHKAGAKQSSACYQFHAGVFGLFFDPDKWKRHLTPKRRLTLNGLHGIIYQNTEFFK
jgi:hypothetical protein